MITYIIGKTGGDWEKTAPRPNLEPRLVTCTDNDNQTPNSQEKKTYEKHKYTSTIKQDLNERHV